VVAAVAAARIVLRHPHTSLSRAGVRAALSGGTNGTRGQVRGIVAPRFGRGRSIA
jgi:hypothetical protein